MLDTMQLGAIGVDILVTVLKSDGLAEDLSTATVKDFVFQRPDGSRVRRTGSFLTDGTDGKIVYTTGGGDIDQPGQWSVTLDLKVSGINFQGRTSVGQFVVDANIGFFVMQIQASMGMTGAMQEVFTP